MRIWLDTMVAANIDLNTLNRVINEGNTLVIANTAIDVSIFQNEPAWFEDKLLKKHIIIEIWQMPDEMTKKPFFWSSCSMETKPADTLEMAVKSLPNADNILKVANLVMKYGLPKGTWPMGKWAPPAPLTADAADILGIPQNTSNRSEILNAAVRCNRIDVFSSYNCDYNRGLATQHTCDAILNVDGSYTKL